MKAKNASLAAGALLSLLLLIAAAAPGTSPLGVAAPGPDLAEVQHPIRKPPYLIFTGDNGAMRVNWQLVSYDTCRIDWGLGTDYSLGSVATHEYGVDHQHSYTLNDLIPSTRYFYRVIAGADTFAGDFWTAPYSNAGEARFFAYGDSRTYPSTHYQVVTEMLVAYALNPTPHSLVTSVGDLVSHGDVEAEWDSDLFDTGYPNIGSMLTHFPFQSCVGNHDLPGALFAKYLTYPFVADRYWSFDYGPAHFVVVDQYVPYGTGSVQHSWIAGDLAASTKPWKFVYLHAPGWSAGGRHGNNVTVQNDIQPLCEQYGVSIVFAGHNHYYARAEVNGVQHVTTGGGGAILYQPDLGYPNVVTAAAAYHFCDIEIRDQTLSFAAVAVGGDTLDTFTLGGTATAVGGEFGRPSDQEAALYDAHPNPFNPTTTISFWMPVAGDVKLSIYSVGGRKVRTLVDTWLGAGEHDYLWDGKDDAGRALSSGLYFYRLRLDDEIQSKKVLLLK